MLFSQAGELLTDTSNYLFPLLNDALEWFTNEVNNHGVDTFVKETVLTPVTPIPVVDPGLQVHIDDLGYYDSVNANIAPQLPTDLLVPVFIWERQTGTTEEWVEMSERPDGLPSIQQSSREKIWEWRQDGLYMPGATQSNDLRLRYTGSQASFVTPDDIFFYRGANGPLAWKLVATWLVSKNPQAAQAANGEATARIGALFTRNARMKQREAITRRSYGNPQLGQGFIPPRNT